MWVANCCTTLDGVSNKLLFLFTNLCVSTGRSLKGWCKLGIRWASLTVLLLLYYELKNRERGFSLGINNRATPSLIPPNFMTMHSEV
jgi:hypothetical protein